MVVGAAVVVVVDVLVGDGPPRSPRPAVVVGIDVEPVGAVVGALVATAVVGAVVDTGLGTVVVVGDGPVLVRQLVVVLEPATMATTVPKVALCSTTGPLAGPAASSVKL